MKNIILLLVLNVLLGACSKHKEQPNFLFILTDDQTYNTISALGNDEIETPNMDKLVQEGLTFTHCFNQGSWSGAVCVASRTMLITGQTLYNAPKNKIYLDRWAQINEKRTNYTPTEVTTWAEAFTNQGYETFITGKWHNSKYAAVKGFDIGKAVGDGMYHSLDKDGNKGSAYNRPEIDNTWTPWDTDLKGHWSPKVWDIVGDKNDGEPYVINQHTSELYADKAIAYLEHKKSLDPFFMYVAFNAPHDPRQSPKEFVDKYPASSINIPENYLPEHPFNQGDNRIRDEKLAPFPRTKEAVQLHLSEYYAIITHFDYQLGRILKKLEETGKTDNTYIILTSDHGLAAGQHGLMGKQNQYDHSVRMPFIITGPNIEKGKKINDMVYMQSIYATTCELANIPVPQTVEFKSLKNLLNGAQGGEDFIYGAYRNMQRMIRSDKYKLIVYPLAKEIQLFDLEQDPLEIKNIVKDEEYKNIVEDYFGILVKKQNELGDKLILNRKDYKFTINK